MKLIKKLVTTGKDSLKFYLSRILKKKIKVFLKTFCNKNSYQFKRKKRVI